MANEIENTVGWWLGTVGLTVGFLVVWTLTQPLMKTIENGIVGIRHGTTGSTVA